MALEFIHGVHRVRSTSSLLSFYTYLFKTFCVFLFLCTIAHVWNFQDCPFSPPSWGFPGIRSHQVPSSAFTTEQLTLPFFFFFIEKQNKTPGIPKESKNLNIRPCKTIPPSSDHVPSPSLVSRKKRDLRLLNTALKASEM